VLAGPAYRWDALGYTTIAQHGYTTARSTVLFPLYPLLIRGLSVVVGSPVLAGLLISLSAFAIGLTLVHRIASDELGRRAAVKR
jgi:Gpi18-like mannosyltransferase